MKNNLFYFLIFFLVFNFNLVAQDLEINSSQVEYDNINKITIFKGNVNSNDKKGNKLFSEYAKYNKTKGVIKTEGKTRIVTSGGYEVSGSNIVFNNKKSKIYSNNKALIIDKDGNNISVEMFDYSTKSNIFFSKGNIKIKDINNNNYNFS